MNGAGAANAAPLAWQRREKYDIGNIMEAEFGLRLPPELLAEFSEIIRGRVHDHRDADLAAQLRDLFDDEYLLRVPVSALLIRCAMRHEHCTLADPWIGLYMMRQSVAGEADPGSAFAEVLTAMGVPISILDRHSHLIESSTETAVYLRCLVGSPVWGVGIASESATATLKAILSAANRASQVTCPPPGE